MKSHIGTEKKFPKVLIITNSTINDTDAHGAFFRNYFHEWPRDRLAKIYQTNTGSSTDFNIQEYQLKPNDRKFGKIYARIRRSPLGVGATTSTWDQRSKISPSGSVLRSVFDKLSKFLINSGIWELFFYPKPSSELLEWVKRFDPDVIYFQGYSLFYLRLPLILNKHSRGKLCMHMLDDWPKFLYQDTVFSPLVRPLVKYWFKKALKQTDVRLCISEKMARDYENRYGFSFKPMFNCDDSERFKTAIPELLVEGNIFSIVYSGSIGLNRWKGLVEIACAANELSKEGFRFHVSAFVPDVPLEAVDALKRAPNLSVHSSLNNEKVPSVFKGADILFLSESFDKEFCEYTRLAIATKAHLYMMANKPILVYGPAEAGVVSYAKEFEWGYVVTQQEQPALIEALRILVTNSRLCDQLINRGDEVARLNHEASVVREEFRSVF